MFRYKSVRAASYAVLTGTLFFAVNSACMNAFDPCPDTQNIEDIGQMDGRWTLTLIGASAPPAPDPTKSTRLIRSGVLSFQTTLFERDGNGCADISKTFGNVIGSIEVTENGVTKFKRGTGRFDKDHSNGKVTLHAAGFELPATQNGSSTLFVTNAGQPGLIFAAGGTASATFTR